MRKVVNLNFFELIKTFPLSSLWCKVCFETKKILRFKIHISKFFAKHNFTTYYRRSNPGGRYIPLFPIDPSRICLVLSLEEV